MQPDRLTLEPTEEEIQHAAFLLWEAEGRPAGRDLEIWLAAKERLKHTPPRHGRDPHRQKNAAHRPRDAQRVRAAGR